MSAYRDGAELVFDRYLPSIEREMRSVIRDHDPGQGELFGLIRYHLGWVDRTFEPCDAASGKRVRPVLCLLACEACGGPWEQALPAASAVELLHNFTLIHDDIEDEDERRRNRLTVWSVWGQAQGINAGDTLFSVSQLAMLRLRDREVPLTVVVQALQLFNEMCVALTTGQHLDIDFEGRAEVSVDEYVTMIEGKTAALIACSCELGALVAGAAMKERRHLREFGHHAGLAFQMRDDALGIWGDPAVTGKPVGADIARGKKTLPILHGSERSGKLRALLAQDTLSQDDVMAATDLLDEAGSRAYVEQLAREQYELAMKALDAARVTDHGAEALRDLAERLLTRRR